MKPEFLWRYAALPVGLLVLLEMVPETAPGSRERLLGSILLVLYAVSTVAVAAWLLLSAIARRSERRPRKGV